jgi:hypothetical protein
VQDHLLSDVEVKISLLKEVKAALDFGKYLTLDNAII